MVIIPTMRKHGFFLFPAGSSATGSSTVWMTKRKCCISTWLDTDATSMTCCMTWRVTVQQHHIFGRSARLTYTGYAAPDRLPKSAAPLNGYIRGCTRIRDTIRDISLATCANSRH